MLLPEMRRPGRIMDLQPGAARDHDRIRHLDLLNELDQPAALFIREPLINYPLRRAPMVEGLTRELPDLTSCREIEEIIQHPVHLSDVVSVEAPLTRLKKAQTVIKVYLSQGVQP